MEALLGDHVVLCVFCRSGVEALLGDHVVLRGERTGRVCYLGHVDGAGHPQSVFAGIELDAPGECQMLSGPSSLVYLVHCKCQMLSGHRATRTR